MDNFSFYSPTFFEFGKEAQKKAGELITKFGGTKVLIHYGGGSVIRTGLLDTVKKSLQDSKIDFLELGGAKPNPRSSLVYEGIKLCKENNIDFVLAVGGGSAIDSAKAIAAGSVYDGDFWDFYKGKRIDKALPVATVLTISAAGSEGSGDSVITHEEGMYKRGASGEAIRPRFSILNPELTKTLPPYQTACGITDIMAHLYERYLTNTKEVEVTDRLIEALMMTVIKEGKKALDNPDDYDSRANIMWAGMMAHNNSCGVGRTQDWTSHDVEHELSALYDCAHGAGLAVVMPAVFTYNMNHDITRFAKLAVRVWNCEYDYDNPSNTAKAGIKALANFLRSIGMPSSLEELGGSKEDIEKLANIACFGDGRTGIIGGFVPINQTDVENIYRLTLKDNLKY